MWNGISSRTASDIIIMRATQKNRMSWPVIRTSRSGSSALHFLGVFRPAERAEGPEAGGEPGVEDVGVAVEVHQHIENCLQPSARMTIKPSPSLKLVEIRFTAMQFFLAAIQPSVAMHRTFSSCVVHQTEWMSSSISSSAHTKPESGAPTRAGGRCTKARCSPASGK